MKSILWPTGAALAAASAALVLAQALPASASSHREAPFITSQPKVDATDFYMFRSYEPGREGFITLIANYLPLQDAYGGPNYFALDPDALYEIHIDNNGDAVEDITFQFRFSHASREIALTIGGKSIAIPLIQAGMIDSPDAPLQNFRETFKVNIVRGHRRGTREAIVDAASGGTEFERPLDNIGQKTFGGGYAAYAGKFVYRIAIPGCGEGRMFVGQRKDPFVVALGKIFDLINLNPLGPPDGEGDKLDDKNVTSLVLEVPATCLTNGLEPVIGGWTTASLRQGRLLSGSPSPGLGKVEFQGGAFTQVSRLGMPLVNELVIGLRDKDRFNASRPSKDGRFADYVTNPTLPALIQTLFPTAPAPTNFPRQDLVAAFLTGVPGLNQPANVQASEMLRLNTTTATTPAGSQSNLGVLGNDLAGFPNGRRPGDDVVDIELRVAMGVLCTLNAPAAFGCVPGDAPAGGAPLTDGARVTDANFDVAFPYLRLPLPGSPD